MTKCWMAHYKLMKEDNWTPQSGCSESRNTSCCSAKMDLCLTILCHLVSQSMANSTAHSCRIR
jgi:hypothetical protein